MLALAEKPMSLDEIAALLRERDRQSKLNAYEMGRLYTAAKEQLRGERGAFGRWCDTLRLHSRVTRASYMRIFRECRGHPERLGEFGPSKLAFLCSALCPPEFREQVFRTGKHHGSEQDLRDAAESWDAPQEGNYIRPAIRRRCDKEWSRLRLRAYELRGEYLTSDVEPPGALQRFIELLEAEEEDEEPIVIDESNCEGASQVRVT